MILYLTLHRSWFDLIQAGEKTEEYRELKKYWIDRILKSKEPITHLHFANGYSPVCRKMVVEVQSIRMGKPKVKYSRQKARCIVISLGRIVWVGNDKFNPLTLEN